ncbi:hypothetical protein FOLKNPGA_02797 [Legionella sp. PC1000]|uniref:hypothetical protein n=1 Tax=Legionella sp. PC1000 TaxID=2746060 RepID=UPI0015FE356B|nr:hypothetical protein [Legionella sp. PC1000]QLZ69997.1 hypothetical protein FOLKNPGA_02797 [Legionella sp. PC1000]
MLSKEERFKRWRGTRFYAEQNALNSALLISNYVNSVDNLEAIKANAQTKYNDFDQYNARPWGTAVFVKLFIDEAIAQLPEDADKELALLTHSSEVISTLYDNWKDNTAGNIFALLGDIEKLITLDSIPFTDKNQYKTFLLSSYMLFHIIKLAIAQIEGNWKAQIVVSLLVDLGQIKPKIDLFLLQVEKRMEQLKAGQSAKMTNDTVPDPLKPFKDLLSERYLKVLGIKPVNSAKLQRGLHNTKRPAPAVPKFHLPEKTVKRTIHESLNALEADIEKVSSGIFSLIEQRSKKADLEAKIEAVNKLLLFAEENDKKITARKDFLDFIEEHAQLFQVLLETAEEDPKQQLLEKIKQLKNIVESPDLSSEVLQRVSWVTSPIKVVYRTTTPQVLQSMIASTLPATLDSTCKAELKNLANTCLLDLREKLKKKEHQITAINNRFFNQDEALKLLIAQEGSERLALLQKANEIMKESVQASSRLLATVKENSSFLRDLQAKSQTLSAFIKLHDGFFVKISNFLAQYFSFFKTRTAKMIDDAAAWKIKVDGLVGEYQNIVDGGIRQIELIPNLNDSIKVQIKSQFIAEEQQIRREKQNHIHPNKRAVRLLMNNLSHLFAAKPLPLREQTNEKVLNEEQSILACF